MATFSSNNSELYKFSFYKEVLSDFEIKIFNFRLVTRKSKNKRLLIDLVTQVKRYVFKLQVINLK